MMNARIQATFRQIMCISLLLCNNALARSQAEPSSGDGPMGYENHNQTDYKALIIRAVVGKAHDEQGVPIPNVSLGLFTEKDHKLVTVVESAADGTFEFRKVTPGLYRLVAKYNGFCAANVPIEVRHHASTNRVVDLHMKPARLDTCSYGTVALKSFRTAALP